MKICDLHNDFLGELSADKLQGYINEIEEQGVEFVNASFWTTKKQNPLKELKTKIKKISDFKCVHLHIEDMGFLQKDDNIIDLIKLKPFSVSLTWNNDNIFAGGALGDGNLTKKGVKLVKFLQKNEIFIDLSHLNKKSFYSVLDFLEHPPLVTHTGFDALVSNPRNIDNNQIKQIIDRNGFIGLFFFDRCIRVTNNFSAKDIALNIAWFADNFGTGNLGMGSDFYGIENYPENLLTYNDFGKLAKELKNTGFSNYEIEKVFNSNFNRYLLRSR